MGTEYVIAMALYILGLPITAVALDALVGWQKWKWEHYVLWLLWPLFGLTGIVEVFWDYIKERF